MKLEAIDPLNLSAICVAKLDKYIQDLAFVNISNMIFLTQIYIYIYALASIITSTFMTVATHMADRLRGSMASSFIPSWNLAP
jgi:hypothetical protein